MHDTIDSEFCQFGNPLRESASEQVGISALINVKSGPDIMIGFKVENRSFSGVFSFLRGVRDDRSRHFL